MPLTGLAFWIVWLVPTIATFAVCVWKRRLGLGASLAILSLVVPIAIFVGLTVALDVGSGSMASGFIGFAYGSIAAVVVPAVSLLVALFTRRKQHDAQI
jgi:F0F1-type ATP synthase assembly protein I